jgi:imidazoleglycerol-phosphate dehydratase
MADRFAKTERKTKETDILVEMNLDGEGKYEIDTGVAFLDHMLTHVGKHGKIDLTIKARGDLEVDAHHTVEDVGICMGNCLCEAIGNKKGIARFGNSVLPMEDAKAEVTVDLSGRAFCVYDVKYHTEKIGDFDVECIEEFLRSFASAGKLNLHVSVPYGSNSHHIAEAVFKGLGQSLALAVKIVGTDIPSTKGTL